MSIPGRQTPVQRPALTAREREVLSLLAQGRSDAEIGRILNISRRTAQEHVKNARDKLKAANRTEAVVIALREHQIEF